MTMMNSSRNGVTLYLDQPCERCGSKKRISKTWKEKVPTFTGTTVVEYSQIVCSQKDCQMAFDKDQLEQTEKREAIKHTKELTNIARKAHALQQANKGRKSKSRI